MDSEEEQLILSILDAYSVKEILPKRYKVLIYGTAVIGSRLSAIEKHGYRIVSIEPELVLENTGDGIESSIDTYIILVQKPQ